jgi:hypothetical protein
MMQCHCSWVRASPQRAHLNLARTDTSSRGYADSPEIYTRIRRCICCCIPTYVSNMYSRYGQGRGRAKGVADSKRTTSLEEDNVLVMLLLVLPEEPGVPVKLNCTPVVIVPSSPLLFRKSNAVTCMRVRSYHMRSPSLSWGKSWAPSVSLLVGKAWFRTLRMA